MDPSMRNSRALNDRLDKMQSESLRRFQNLLGLAAVNSNDRTVTAGMQLQMATETTALIRSFEEIQSVIREMQELWLQGPLNTLGDSKAKQNTEDNAKAVAEMLQHLVGMQQNQQQRQQQGQAAPAG